MGLMFTGIFHIIFSAVALFASSWQHVTAFKIESLNDSFKSLIHLGAETSDSIYVKGIALSNLLLTALTIKIQ